MVPRKDVNLFRNVYQTKVVDKAQFNSKSIQFTRKTVSVPRAYVSTCRTSHIFKHLQNSQQCRTSYSNVCFQLQIKEAIHIQWQKPVLKHQLSNYVNLTFLCNILLCHVSFCSDSQLALCAHYIFNSVR